HLEDEDRQIDVSGNGGKKSRGRGMTEPPPPLLSRMQGSGTLPPRSGERGAPAARGAGEGELDCDAKFPQLVDDGGARPPPPPTPSRCAARHPLPASRGEGKNSLRIKTARRCRRAARRN